jgi:hypothetical protein
MCADFRISRLQQPYPIPPHRNASTRWVWDKPAEACLTPSDLPAKGQPANSKAPWNRSTLRRNPESTCLLGMCSTGVNP